MNGGIRSRLLQGIAANGFSQVAGIVLQLVSVPVFLKGWGVPLYGEWLILMAVAGYATILDFGYINVSSNEMAMRAARGDRAGALRVFQSCWVWVTSISVAALGSASLLAEAGWLKHFVPSLEATPAASTTLVLLAVHFLLQLQQGILSSAMRSEAFYAEASLFDSCTRILEFSALLPAILLGAGPRKGALILVGIRLSALILMRARLKTRAPHFRFGWTHASRRELRSLARPAITFLGIPIANVLSGQTIVAVLGGILGPAQVVVYSTLRTMCRLCVQMAGMVNNALWTEMSLAHGVARVDLTRKLHRHAILASLWMSLLCAGGLLVAGGWIIQLWTRGNVAIDWPTFALLLASVSAQANWQASSLVLTATNRHTRMALAFLILAIMAVALTRGLAPVLGIRSAAGSLFLMDGTLLALVLRQSLHHTQDRLGEVLRFTLSPSGLKSILRKMPLPWAAN